LKTKTKNPVLEIQFDKIIKSISSCIKAKWSFPTQQIECVDKCHKAAIQTFSFEHNSTFDSTHQKIILPIETFEN
jgi:hypothetical protein